MSALFRCAALALLLVFPLHAQNEAGDPKPIDDGEATLQETDLRKHLEFLCSDEMRGRMATSDEARKAATYIEEHMKTHGLKPAGERKGEFVHKFKVLNKIGWNVCGILPGSHPGKRREFIVIGAHYDHVGIGAFGSRSPEARGQVHNGADDNGSGTSAMLELIEAFAKKPIARSILFIAFSGEEVGLIGSKAWVKDPTVPLNRITTMINLDMIGRSRDRYLFVGGLNTCRRGFEKTVREQAEPFGLRLELHGGGMGPSDFAPFHEAKVPVLFLFTNEHPQYHKPEDDIELIKGPDHLRVVRYAYRLVRELGDGRRPKFREAKRNAMPASSSRGYDEIDRFLEIAVTASDAGAVKVTEVKRSGLGSKVGIKEGDRILEVGGRKIGTELDLQSALALVPLKGSVVIEWDQAGRTRKAKLRR